MTYLATFFTHSGAIKYEKHLQSLGIAITLMPVPRKLSSSCGVAARFDYDSTISSMISDDLHELYECQGLSYTLIYNADT